MDSSRSTKKRKVCKAIGQDKISQLPDGILSHILGFLPTREAVQTTVLSKRWKNLWISIPNLDLDEFKFRRKKFDKFVDGVLSRHTSNIQKFRLHRKHIHCHNAEDADDYLSRYYRWICDAINHNVIELDLDLDLDHFLPNNHGRSRRLGKRQLPESFFTCRTLVVLKVSSNCMSLAPPPSASSCLPSLKSLYYIFSTRRSASQFQKLVSRCPMLEDLTVDAAGISFEKDVYTLSIHAAAFKRFKFVSEYLTDEEYSFSINAPKLEKFVVSGEAGLYNFPNNAKAMVKAVIHLSHPHQDYCEIMHVKSAPQLLEAVSGVKYLCLSAPRFSTSSLPCFYNLKHLKVRLFICSYWEYVMELLKRSPILEDIVLDICPWTWMDKHYMDEIRPFNPPEDVPSCVSSHVKTVSIINFREKCTNSV